MKNDTFDFPPRVRSKRIFIYAVGLFSNGEVCMTPNDMFACAEQNLVDIAISRNLHITEVYVYKVSYDISSGRPTVLIPTNIDPCCLCVSLLSNLLLVSSNAKWNFWGRGIYHSPPPHLPSETNPWRADCNDKFLTKRKFVTSLIYSYITDCLY